MSRRTRSGAILVSLVFFMAAGATCAPPARAEKFETTWLAMGDSFSSGEGLRGARGDCQRAGLFSKSDSSAERAWSVVAWRNLRERFQLAEGPFVPCSGAITDTYSDQLVQAERSGRTKWDVITLSFGGNNVDFGGVIKGCVDVSSGWDLADITPGCDVSFATLKRRIDVLSAERLPAEKNRYGYIGKVTLRQLLSEVRKHVNPGGRVVVAGYPALIETPDRWSFLQKLAPDKPSIWSPTTLGQTPDANCNGVWEYDVPMLRAAGAYLNEVISDEVDHQNAMWLPEGASEPDGVTFAYADLANDVYETGSSPEDRHGLCSKYSWINDGRALVQEGKPRLERMFHPNNSGQRFTGEHVAQTFPNDIRNSRGWVVRPGQLGPLRIGMTAREAIRRGFARPEVRDDDGCVSPYLDTTLGAPALGDPPVRTKWEDNRLIWIAVRNEYFRTPNGNRVGQRLDAVGSRAGPTEPADFEGWRRVERAGRQLIIYYDADSDGVVDRIAMGTGDSTDLEPC